MGRGTLPRLRPEKPVSYLGVYRLDDPQELIILPVAYPCFAPFHSVRPWSSGIGLCSNSRRAAYSVPCVIVTPSDVARRCQKRSYSVLHYADAYKSWPHILSGVSPVFSQDLPFTAHRRRRGSPHVFGYYQPPGYGQPYPRPCYRTGFAKRPDINLPGVCSAHSPQTLLTSHGAERLAVKGAHSIIGGTSPLLISR